MWIPIATIVANVQVIQTIELFGLVATLGNIVYASSFLVTDILSELYGRKEARKAIWIGFFSVIAMTLLMNIALLFKPLEGDAFASETYKSLDNIFSLMPRIVIASLTAYLLSQQHDIWAYHFWRQRFPGTKRIWIRNNLSTVVSQFIDSIVFTIIAFWGIYEMPVLIEIFATTYVLKWIVAVADTPFIYWAANIGKKDRFILGKESL
jgi:uncharacterized integral membrane protein (TIGR00697 family)